MPSVVIEEEYVVKDEFEVSSFNTCREICSHILIETWKSTGLEAINSKLTHSTAGKRPCSDLGSSLLAQDTMV